MLGPATLVVIVCALTVATVEAQRRTRSVDYAGFSHSTHVTKQKLACDSCHKFPTKNWKEVRKGDAAFPDVADFPEHASCLNCHRREFFARERPAPRICSNCHVKATPRDTARFLFPSLGDVVDSGKLARHNVAEFAVKFPHEKHEDQECVTCHQLDKEGEVKTKPNSHTVCFSCHNVESELPPAPSTCNACHKLASASSAQLDTVGTATSASRLDTVSTTRGSGWVRSHAATSQIATHPPATAGGTDLFQVQENYSQFKHDNRNHARLPCLLCHRRENNSTQPTLPGKAAHAPCTGCHAQQFASPASEICTICHTDVQNGKVKAFPALRSFDARFDHAKHAGAACATCHRGNRGGVGLSVPSRLNAHVTCFGCHTPNAQANGRNISSCSTCHQPGRLVRTPEQAAAYRVGFSHARHDASEKLACAACHQVRGRQVSAPLPLNHHAPVSASSCATCHNGQRAFGGDDFSVCKRCHKGSQWKF